MSIIVCIDGPAGSGKGTLARGVAAHFAWAYLDTGALYRQFAVALIDHFGLPTAFQADAAPDPFTQQHVDIARAAVEQAIGAATPAEDARLRAESTGSWASYFAAMPPVRAALLDLQRSYAHARHASGVVLDGRDTGTVIAPHAEVKIFLEATPEARAMRRKEQLLAKGIKSDYYETLSAIISRDHADRTRAVAPLIAATDAHVIDSSHQSIEEVLNETITLIQARLP